MQLSIDDTLTKTEADFVQEKLLEFADNFTGPRKRRELGVALRNKNGIAVGGITASTLWDWLLIGNLWIPEEVRRMGYGSQLLGKIEELGRELGCRFAKLDTFEFEAKEFYESHGYRVDSKTDGFPAGHTQFHLTKEL